MPEVRAVRVPKVGRRYSLRVEEQWPNTESQTQGDEQDEGAVALHRISDPRELGGWKGQPSANRSQKGEAGIHAE